MLFIMMLVVKSTLHASSLWDASFTKIDHILNKKLSIIKRDYRLWHSEFGTDARRRGTAHQNWIIDQSRKI